MYRAFSLSFPQTRLLAFFFAYLLWRECEIWDFHQYSEPELGSSHSLLCSWVWCFTQLDLGMFSSADLLCLCSLRCPLSPCPSCSTTPPPSMMLPPLCFTVGRVLVRWWRLPPKVQPVLDHSRNSSFSQSDRPADAFSYQRFSQRRLKVPMVDLLEPSPVCTQGRSDCWFWFNDFLYSKILFHVTVVDWKRKLFPGWKPRGHLCESDPLTSLLHILAPVIISVLQD